MTARDMDCVDVVELVTAYLEDALDPQTKEDFEAHLTVCEGCANYLEQVRRTTGSLAELRSETLDPVFRARLLSAFNDWQGR
ncbi:zf-HC2 domain-containing protein [Antrihabitans stalactiti]